VTVGLHAKSVVTGTTLNASSYQMKHIRSCDLDTRHWFCKTCNDKVGKIIPSLAGLQERMTVTEKTVNKMENDMEKNDGQIIKVKSDIVKISGDLNTFKSEMTNISKIVHKLT